MRRAQDRERLRRYRADNPEATRRYAKAGYDAHPEKVKARRVLNTAIRYGRLERGACEVGVDCEGRVEAHHDDYSRPLDVRWFCVKHHAEVERWAEMQWEAS